MIDSTRGQRGRSRQRQISSGGNGPQSRGTHAGEDG
jgi:hypothetical protein